MLTEEEHIEASRKAVGYVDEINDIYLKTYTEWCQVNGREPGPVQQMENGQFSDLTEVCHYVRNNVYSIKLMRTDITRAKFSSTVKPVSVDIEQLIASVRE